jgi:hypothetical protein
MTYRGDDDNADMVFGGRFRDWIGGWDPEKPGREPDIFDFRKRSGGWDAIWYSGSGPEDSDYATMVGRAPDPGGFYVTDYTRYESATGERDPEGVFLMQSVEFSENEVRMILLTEAHPPGTEKGTPAGRFRIPRDPKMLARWVIGLGLAKIAYAGKDDWTNELP